MTLGIRRKVRAVPLVLSGLFALACGPDKPTAPVAPVDDAAIASGITTNERVLAAGQAAPFQFMVRFPDAIALTPTQLAAIRQLIDAHVQANTADLTALEAIMRELIEARRAGASMPQLRAILERAHPIRLRLVEAQQQLERAIWNVLTPAQQSYIESLRNRAPCELTPEQVSQLRALHQEFERVHAADLGLQRQVMLRIAQAIRDGATREQIEAMLAEARSVHERLAEARARLAEQMRAIIGNSECVALPPPPPPGIPG